MYLITQSLISSLNYIYDSDDPIGARQDFLRVLNREPTEQNEYMKNGSDFEHEVNAIVRGEKRTPHPKWESGIQAVATILTGAVLQYKKSKPLIVDGTEYLVYGILDALREGTIFDIKFLNKSFNSVDLAGKYLRSAQHPTYFYLMPETEKFIYLVSDGQDVYQEEYFRDDVTPFETILRQFLANLELLSYDMGIDLMEIYKEKWQAR